VLHITGLGVEPKIDDLMQAVREIIQNQQQLSRDLAEVKEVVREIRLSQPIDRKKPGPDFSPSVQDGQVLIGIEGHRTDISKDDLFDAFEKSKSGQDYCLKLMDKLFTKVELRASNYNGGKTVVGAVPNDGQGAAANGQRNVVEKRKLRTDPRFVAIMGQVVKDFGELKTEEEKKYLRNAVNGKCRKS